VPVIKRTLREHPAEPREALLKLKIIDPACGSGHFLLAAARRLAAEIARLDAGPDTPGETLRQHALREVVQHGIYGVDRNPLAVELCRTALWMETVEPGKPLTFLDAHIRCGDSLVGVLDPEVMDEGIPDEAYKDLTGDDKKLCGALKKRNKQGKGGGVQGSLFDQQSLQTATVTAVDLDAMPEETLADIEAKRQAWEQAEQDAAHRQAQLRANLFTGAFFAAKTAANGNRVPLTEDLNRIAKGLAPRPELEAAVDALAAEHRFFHWHLAFPEVFAQGGFDVVLGNPPWERIKLQDQEFFAARSPEIADAANKAARDRLIKTLARAEATPGEQALYRAYLDARHLRRGFSERNIPGAEEKRDQGIRGIPHPAAGAGGLGSVGGGASQYCHGENGLMKAYRSMRVESLGQLKLRGNPAKSDSPNPGDLLAIEQYGGRARQTVCL
jgi:hypothetical protein